MTPENRHRQGARELFDLILKGCDAAPMDGFAYRVLVAQLEGAARILKEAVLREKATTGSSR